MRHSRDCEYYEPLHIHCPDHCAPNQNPDLGPDDIIIAHRHIEGEHEMENPQCWCKPFFYTGEEIQGRSPEEIYAEIEQRERNEEPSH